MIYVARITSGPLAGAYKIGHTTTPAKRTVRLASRTKGEAELVALLPGTMTDERRLHVALADARFPHGRSVEFYRAAAEPFASWLAALPAEARAAVAEAPAVDAGHVGAVCGGRLRVARIAAGLSLIEAGRRAGVRHSTWQTWEQGALPNVIDGRRAARAVGANVNAIWPEEVA